jgi:hypothetical protein
MQTLLPEIGGISRKEGQISLRYGYKPAFAGHCDLLCKEDLEKKGVKFSGESCKMLSEKNQA